MLFLKSLLIFSCLLFSLNNVNAAFEERIQSLNVFDLKFNSDCRSCHIIEADEIIISSENLDGSFNIVSIDNDLNTNFLHENIEGFDAKNLSREDETSFLLSRSITDPLTSEETQEIVSINDLSEVNVISSLKEINEFKKLNEDSFILSATELNTKTEKLMNFKPSTNKFTVILANSKINKFSTKKEFPAIRVSEEGFISSERINFSTVKCNQGKNPCINGSFNRLLRFTPKRKKLFTLDQDNLVVDFLEFEDQIFFIEHRNSRFVDNDKFILRSFNPKKRKFSNLYTYNNGKGDFIHISEDFIYTIDGKSGALMKINRNTLETEQISISVDSILSRTGEKLVIAHSQNISLQNDPEIDITLLVTNSSPL